MKICSVVRRHQYRTSETVCFPFVSFLIQIIQAANIETRYFAPHSGVPQQNMRKFVQEAHKRVWVSASSEERQAPAKEDFLSIVDYLGSAIEIVVGNDAKRKTWR